MQFQFRYTSGLWLFMVSAMIILVLLIFSWRYRRSSSGRCFIILMVCAFLWVSNFILETASLTLAWKIFFARIEFIGITFIPAMWFFLVREFTNRRILGDNWLVVLVIPVVTNVIIWSNPLHHWFMGTPFIISDTPFPVVDFDYQWWFYAIHAPYGYLLIGCALMLLLRSIPSMNGVYRMQSCYLLVAIILPAITDVLYVMGISPVQHYNFTTAVFSISGSILFYSLFHFQFLDLLPLARDSIINNLYDGVIILDHKDRIVEINPSAKGYLALEDSAIGKEFMQVNNEMIKKVQVLMKENVEKGDIKIGKQAPTYFDVRVNTITKKSGTHIGRVIAFRDITERVELFNQVQALAVQDSLTGIFNRRSFMEFSKREIYRVLRNTGYAVSLVMIDLDNFKAINDQYGHRLGDKALVTFTTTIQKQLREFDIFGRVGGEEFAILLADTDARTAIQITERLRTAVEALRIQTGKNREVSITASFGVVSSLQLRKKDIEINNMLDLADQALYEAKQKGRNQVVLVEL